MSGSDLSAFIGTVLAQVAPVVLAVVIGALFAINVLAGIASFVNRE